jgi:hypothetical protein
MPLNSTRGAGSAKGFGLTAGAAAPVDIDFLVVAGGGSGGGREGGGGGGGGGGGFRTVTRTIKGGETLTLTVGARAEKSTGYQGGGTGGASQVTGDSGFVTFQSSGGGGGGGYQNTGQPGGSGGGGSPIGTGNIGGYSPVEGYNASGTSGGGAGGVGGPGASSSITGSPVTYAAGNQPAPVAVNTGNGSAARTNNSDSTNNFSGTGVIILKVPTSGYKGKTTGSPTVTTDGAYTIVTYTGTGTYINK